MEAKLIKTNKSELGYILSIDVATLKGIMPNNYKLSLKNCEAIERGYDLDKLATKYYKEFDNLPVIRYNAFTAGAKAILEILGDKKFSEEDMKKAYNQGEEDCYKSGAVSEKRNKYIQSLQQTEWNCIVEMEGFVDEEGIYCGERPKLDADGCLILKRV